MSASPAAPAGEVVLRPMAAADLAGADRLRSQVGFNQRTDDWLNLLRWEPEGCFVAVASGEVVGTVTTTTFGRRLAWVGMLLVDEGHRRKAVGSRLLQAALDAVASADCVALDATPAGRELYVRRGFDDRARLTRWLGTVVPARRGVPSVEVAPLHGADLVEVSALDEAVVGVDRSRVLAELARHPDCWTARRDGQLVGAVLTRPGSRHHVVGPLLALGVDVARDLVTVAFARLVGCSVVVDVPDGSPVEAWLRERGLAPQRPLVRMSTAPLPTGPHAYGLHAIASPEVG